MVSMISAPEATVLAAGHPRRNERAVRL